MNLTIWRDVKANEFCSMSSMILDSFKGLLEFIFL